MITWLRLNDINVLPKNGTRTLIANYNKTWAQKDEKSDPYPIFGLFEIDIVVFNWEFPEDDNYIIWSKDYAIVTAQYILDKYTVYSIINLPEIY